MRYLTVILSLICMMFTANAAKAERRVAFVVGNGAYKNVAQLPNPPVDAKAMAAVLRNVGFDVVEGTNLTRDKMTEKLLDFGKKAQGADVAVFFYAGHGIAISGTNYLLPIDADIKSEMDVKLGAAIAHITTPGVEIQQAMTEVRAQVNEETNKGQLPWGHTNLIGSVYLNPAAVPAPGAAAAAPSAAPAAVASTGGNGTDVELEFWRSVKESNKPEELNAYLTSYPNGQFKSLALARIASLENGPSTTTRNLTTGVDPATFTEEANQTTEDQIGLEKGQRRDVQRRLNGLGFDTKVTGKFDDETRAVISRWQAARGYPKTGYLNKLEHKALLAEIVATTQTSSSDESDEKTSRRHHSGGGGGGGGGGRYRGPAGPGGLIGGMMGGLFH